MGEHDAPCGVAGAVEAGKAGGAAAIDGQGTAFVEPSPQALQAEPFQVGHTAVGRHHGGGRDGGVARRRREQGPPLAALLVEALHLRPVSTRSPAVSSDCAR